MTELVLAPTRELAAPATAVPALTVAAAFLAGLVSPRTREAYGCDLRQWFAWCASRGLDPLAAVRAHVDLYRLELEAAGRAPSTRARKLAALAGFYRYALTETDLVDRSPLEHVRRPTVAGESPEMGLDRGELRALLAGATALGPAESALLHLMSLNGLRVSTACHVPVDAIGIQRGHRVLRLLSKGGKEILAPLAPATAAAVDAQLATLPAGETRLFPDWSRRRAHRLVRRLGVAICNHPSLHPHSLRHTFVTLALDAGVPLQDVQDAAGHADPRTTQRYNRARHRLDRHATYRLAGALLGDVA